MGIAKHPSVVTMPATEKPYPSIVEFLFKTFPAISRNRWAERIREGKDHDEEVKSSRGLLRLQPVTSKTHRLRLQMRGLGFGIVNDRVYPDLQPVRVDDFDQPLQLLAKQVRLHQPVAGTDREFRSGRELLWY